MVHISKEIAVNYLNMIALNLTLMAALLRGEGEQKRERGGWGVETLGAQTKQIRKRYGREGAFSIHPLHSLIKSFTSTSCNNHNSAKSEDK